jgi:type IV secretion system protein VirB9
MRVFTVLVLAFGVLMRGVVAAEMPKASDLDARVRYVDYRADDVTVVAVRRGVVTRIVLGQDERILAAATGFTADCTQDSAEWCIRADVGSNQIWVKPREGASGNNLELKTDRHDYSIEFRLSGEIRNTAQGLKSPSEPMYRVIFRYSSPAPAAPAGVPVGPSDEEILQKRLADEKPVLRNTRYTMQVMQGAADIAPSLVFDDGRFTYFRFPDNREIPTIFFISSKGEEARVNVQMQGDLATVQRTGQRFVLRLGRAVVGIWNEGFDPNGVAPVAATTVNGVERALRVSPALAGGHP